MSCSSPPLCPAGWRGLYRSTNLNILLWDEVDCSHGCTSVVQRQHYHLHFLRGNVSGHTGYALAILHTVDRHFLSYRGEKLERSLTVFLNTEHRLPVLEGAVQVYTIPGAIRHLVQCQCLGRDGSECSTILQVEATLKVWLVQHHFSFVLTIQGFVIKALVLPYVVPGQIQVPPRGGRGDDSEAGIRRCIPPLSLTYIW